MVLVRTRLILSARPIPRPIPVQYSYQGMGTGLADTGAGDEGVTLSCPCATFVLFDHSYVSQIKLDIQSSISTTFYFLLQHNIYNNQTIC